jgi:hypothetical protein
MELQSKTNNGTTLTIEYNDNRETVLYLRSERNAIPQFFVVKDEDLPKLYHDIKARYIAYVEYMGSLG